MKKYVFLVLGIVLPTLFVVFPEISQAKGTGIVIDSFQTGDADSGYNEFIIIVNSNEQSINLNGFSLKKKPGTGSYTSLVANFGDYNLGTDQKITVTSSRSNISPKDFTYGSSISDNTSLILFDNKGLVVDEVGYGDAMIYEGNALPNPKAGEVFTRTDMIDTDNNLADFHSSTNASIDKNADKILITELMPNPSEGSEWFELFNPIGSRINLGGLKVCDGLGSTHCYYFAKEDYIEPGYKTYDKDVTKITLNDNGDYLTLLNYDDEVISETDGYEGADDGIGFALFGDEWKWTSKPTKTAENIFEDIFEVEEKSVKTPKPKMTKKTVKKKAVAVFEEDDKPSAELASETTSGEVKSVQTAQNNQETKAVISNNKVGWGLVLLAIFGLVFYTIRESKDKIYAFYVKIRNRNG